MERNRSVATLQIVGGHPCLDLANTVAGRRDRRGVDALATYDDLLDWSLRISLLPTELVIGLRQLAAAAPAEAAAALARVGNLREAVYRVFSATAAGLPAPSGDLSLIGRDALCAQAGRRLSQASGGFAWEWPQDDLDTIAGRLAEGAAALLVGPALGQVKECLARNCGWLFLDTSRNHRRRWCSDEDCGSRVRVSRHRARKLALSCSPG